MGNLNSIKKVSFENIQQIINNPDSYLLINTLSPNDQNCIIKNTILPTNEEEIINKYIKTSNNINIIIYGKNTNDESIYVKYKQLVSLGFKNVSIYIGGLFEWLLLQDIYGMDDFPTTTRENDFLKYKQPKLLFCN